MVESTLQSKKQNSGGEFCGKLEEANPWLAWMGPSPSGKPQCPSPKPAHKWTLEPNDTSESLFDQDFDQFMGSFDIFEPFDDLKDWSDNVELFMEAMSHPPQMADAL